MDYASKFDKEVSTEAPPAGEVKLPGGYVKDNETTVTTALVRELTGADEEVIARTSNKGLLLNTILLRGVTHLGSKEATSADLDSMFSGDRDALLLAIRKVTFGSTVEVKNICTKCNTLETYVIDLDADVPVKTLGDPVTDSMFQVKLKKSTAVVTLPTGRTQKKLMENSDKTSPELVTILLGSCILSIDGDPSVGEYTAASLGLTDREALVEEILNRNPGPRLEEVTKACKACGEDLTFPLSLAGLFRL